MDSVHPDAVMEPAASVAQARAALAGLCQLARHEQKNHRPVIHDPRVRARLAEADIALAMQEQMLTGITQPLTALALAVCNQSSREQLARLRMLIARADGLVIAPGAGSLDDQRLANIIAQAPAVVDAASAPLYAVFVGRSLMTGERRAAFARALLDTIPGSRSQAAPAAASAQVAVHLLERGGRAAQHGGLVERLRSGRCVAAIAALERGAGYDYENVRTRLQQAHGKAALHGRKAVVADGEQADVLFVSARVQETHSVDGPDDDGRSVYCIEATRTGVTRHLLRGIDGRSYAEYALDGVEVSERDLIGPAGDGLPLLVEAIDTGRMELCREALGLMEQLAAEFATQALHSHSDAGLMVAHVAVELERARAAVRLGQAGLLAPSMLARCKAVSAAKHVVGLAGRYIAEQAARAALPGVQGPFMRLQAIDLTWGDAEHHGERYAALANL